jgi:hypothetical protein
MDVATLGLEIDPTTAAAGGDRFIAVLNKLLEAADKMAFAADRMGARTGAAATTAAGELAKLEPVINRDVAAMDKLGAAAQTNLTRTADAGGKVTGTLATIDAQANRTSTAVGNLGTAGAASLSRLERSSQAIGKEMANLEKIASQVQSAWQKVGDGEWTKQTESGVVRITSTVDQLNRSIQSTALSLDQLRAKAASVQNVAMPGPRGFTTQASNPATAAVARAQISEQDALLAKLRQVQDAQASLSAQQTELLSKNVSESIAASTATTESALAGIEAVKKGRMDEARAAQQAASTSLEAAVRAASESMLVSKQVEDANKQSANASAQAAVKSAGEAQAAYEKLGASIKNSVASKESETGMLTFAERMRGNSTLLYQFAALFGPLQTRVIGLANGLGAASMATERLAASGKLAEGGLGAMALRIAPVAATIAALIAVVSAGAIAIHLFHEALSEGTKVEAAQLNLKALTGSTEAATTAYQNFVNLSRNTKFEIPELEKVYNSLFLFRRAGDDVNQTLKDMVTLTAGPAGNLESLARALEQVEETGNVTALSIRAFRTAGIDLVSLLSTSMHISAQQVMEDFKKGTITTDQLRASMHQAAQEGGYFSSVMQLMSTGTSQSFKRLSTDWKQALGQFGAPIDSALGPLIDLVDQKIVELIPKFAEAGAQVGDWIRMITALGKQGEIFNVISLEWDLATLKMRKYFEDQLQDGFRAVGRVVLDLIFPPLLVYDLAKKVSGAVIDGLKNAGNSPEAKAYMADLMASGDPSTGAPYVKASPILGPTLEEMGATNQTQVAINKDQSDINAKIAAAWKAVVDARATAESNLPKPPAPTGVLNPTGKGGESDFAKYQSDLKIINDYWQQYNLIQETAQTETERTRRMMDLQAATVKQLADPNQFKDQLTAGLEDETQRRLAAWRVYESERLRLETETEEKIKAGITSESDAFIFGIHKAVEAWGNAAQQMQQLGTDITNSIANNFSSAIGSVINGTKDAKTAFRDMAVSILQEISQMIIKMLIFRAISSLVGGFSGGGSTSSFGALFGGASSSANFSGAVVAHTGALIGSDPLPKRQMDRSPIAHNEELTVLQHGEGVFTANQMQHLAPTRPDVFTPSQMNALGGSSRIVSVPPPHQTIIGTGRTWVPPTSLPPTYGGLGFDAPPVSDNAGVAPVRQPPTPSPIIYGEPGIIDPATGPTGVRLPPTPLPPIFPGGELGHDANLFGGGPTGVRQPPVPLPPIFPGGELGHDAPPMAGGGEGTRVPPTPLPPITFVPPGLVDDLGGNNPGGTIVRKPPIKVPPSPVPIVFGGGTGNQGDQTGTKGGGPAFLGPPIHAGGTGPAFLGPPIHAGGDLPGGGAAGHQRRHGGGANAPDITFHSAASRLGGTGPTGVANRASSTRTSAAGHSGIPANLAAAGITARQYQAGYNEAINSHLNPSALPPEWYGQWSPSGQFDGSGSLPPPATGGGGGGYGTSPTEFVPDGGGGMWSLVNGEVKGWVSPSGQFFPGVNPSGTSSGTGFDPGSISLDPNSIPGVPFPIGNGWSMEPPGPMENPVYIDPSGGQWSYDPNLGEMARVDPGFVDPTTGLPGFNTDPYNPNFNPNVGGSDIAGFGGNLGIGGENFYYDPASGDTYVYDENWTYKNTISGQPPGGQGGGTNPLGYGPPDNWYTNPDGSQYVYDGDWNYIGTAQPGDPGYNLGEVQNYSNPFKGAMAGGGTIEGGGQYDGGGYTVPAGFNSYDAGGGVTWVYDSNWNYIGTQMTPGGEISGGNTAGGATGTTSHPVNLGNLPVGQLSARPPSNNPANYNSGRGFNMGFTGNIVNGLMQFSTGANGATTVMDVFGGSSGNAGGLGSLGMALGLGGPSVFGIQYSHGNEQGLGDSEWQPFLGNMSWSPNDGTPMPGWVAKRMGRDGIGPGMQQNFWSSQWSATGDPSTYYRPIKYQYIHTSLGLPTGGSGDGAGDNRRQVTGGPDPAIKMHSVRRFHEGGIIGSDDGQWINVDTMPRMHEGGIQPGEQAIIKTDDEGVFTPQQMANLAPVGHGQTNLNQQNTFVIETHVHSDGSSSSSTKQDSGDQQSRDAAAALNRKLRVAIAEETRSGGIIHNFVRSQG